MKKMSKFKNVKRIACMTLAITIVLGSTLSTIGDSTFAATNNNTERKAKMVSQIQPAAVVSFPESISTVFPDGNFAEAIKVKLGKASVSDTVTEADLSSISMTLDVSNKNIQSIEGAQYLTGITRFKLGSNQISDISPLSNLTNLKDVSLYSNQITDISSLSGLTNLTDLALDDNQITDISALSSLTNLFDLSLDNNQIIDISGISGLVNLVYLNLNNNKIVDINPLAGLVKLDTLNAGNNQIADISPLSGLTLLRVVFLNSNKIVDISGLSSCVNLINLSLYNNKIIDVSGLSGLSNLTDLSLHANQISDISALSGLTKLTILSLRENQISDVSPLAGLTLLTFVTLNKQTVTKVIPIPCSTSFTLTSEIKDNLGEFIAPSSGTPVANTLSGNTISWTGLTSSLTKVSYNWSQNVTIGGATTLFSGVLNQPIQVSASLPVIIVPTYTKINVGDSFNPMTGVSATDSEDGTLSMSASNVTGTVDTATAGIYKLTYTVKDADNNSVTATQIVLVNDGTYMDGNAYILKASNFSLNDTDVDTNDVAILSLANTKVYSKSTGDLVPAAGMGITISSIGGYSNTPGIYDITMNVTGDDSATRMIKATVLDTTVEPTPINPINPINPVEPKNVATTTTEAAKTVATGDSTHLFGLGMALLFSMILLGGMSVRNKKVKKNV